jgi:hypothetical protein
MINGNCVPPCPPNTTRQPNGTCAPNEVAEPPPPPPPPPQPPVLDLDIIQPLLCQAPNEMINGNCVPPCPPNTSRQPNGTCAPDQVIQPPVLEPILDLPLQILCAAPKEMVNGQCVDPCPPDQEWKPDGNCGPKLLQINPNVLEIVPNLQLQIDP